MSNIRKKLANFVSLNQSDYSGSHKTNIYRKKDKEVIIEESLKAKKQWFLKEAEPNEFVELEVVAGELYRLFIGNTQPKTRVLEDEFSNRFVASEGVAGFKTVINLVKHLTDEQIIESDLLNYKQLARIYLASMVLAETDLKGDNVGVNHHADLVKIDHDSSLYPLVIKYQGLKSDDITTFTAYDLEHVLTPETYHVSAWSAELTRTLREILSSNKLFQYEVNCAILKILICPFAIINDVININSSNNNVLNKDINQFVNDQLHLLKKEALKSEAFLSFMDNINYDVIDNLKQELKEYLVVNSHYGKDLNLDLDAPINNLIESINIKKLTQRLKIDKSKKEDLIFWSKKVTHGGVEIIHDNVTYKIPDSISKMMDVDDTGSYNDFLTAINKIRTDAKPHSLNFFSAIKNNFFRDPAVNSFYLEADIETIDLSQDDTTQNANQELSSKSKI